jgi:hypothetical protein
MTTMATRPYIWVGALQRKSHLFVPRKGITRPQSQFPLSYVCEQFMYIPRIGPHIFLQQNTLQRQNTEILKQIFPEKEYRGLSPNFHIHASVCDLYIPTIGLPFLLEEICRPLLGVYKIAHRYMNVEIGAEAALFPEKEYINGIFLAV